MKCGMAFGIPELFPVQESWAAKVSDDSHLLEICRKPLKTRLSLFLSIHTVPRICFGPGYHLLAQMTEESGQPGEASRCC